LKISEPTKLHWDLWMENWLALFDGKLGLKENSLTYLKGQ
jgi:fructosamine-3-kinase